MKFLIGIAASLVLAQAAMACPSPRPANCSCDTTTNTWTLNNTNTAKANATANAKGGNATATGGAGGNANATIANGAVQNSNRNVNNVTGGTSSATISSGAVQTSTTVNGGSTTTNYEAPKIPVSPAIAAALAAGGQFICLGSSSAAVQVPFIGASLGHTKEDPYCVLITQTHLMLLQGFKKGACIRMQLNKEGADIKKAMELAGETCPEDVFEIANVIPPAGAPVEYVTQDQLREVEKRITTKMVQK